MLDADTLLLAASGLVPPEVIARLAGMTEAELRARTEPRSPPPSGRVVRRLLSFALPDSEWRNIDACATLLKLSDDDWWAAADAAGLELCPHHQEELCSQARERLKAHLTGILHNGRRRSLKSL